MILVKHTPEFHVWPCLYFNSAQLSKDMVGFWVRQLLHFFCCMPHIPLYFSCIAPSVLFLKASITTVKIKYVTSEKHYTGTPTSHSTNPCWSWDVTSVPDTSTMFVCISLRQSMVALPLTIYRPRSLQRCSTTLFFLLTSLVWGLFSLWSGARYRELDPPRWVSQ